MNKDRRKRLAEAKEQLDEARNIIDEALATIADVKDEEQEAYDNMPESLQNGERGQAMQAATENLEEADSYAGNAVNDLEALIDTINNIVGDLESATGAVEAASE